MEAASSSRLRQFEETRTGDNRPHDNRPHEGRVTRETEARTSRIPSIAFLSAAAGSMVASAALQATGRRKMSLFVGQWAPSFMLMGIYNKIVKVGGSD